LENQIHHLDKAHHYFELADIYFQQGKFEKAERGYRAAMERDSEDIDIRAHLGQCLLRQQRPGEAKPLLERVCAEKADHDYGFSMMALAECLTALGEKEAAEKVWNRVLEAHSYSRARVQLAELYLEQGKNDEAKRELTEAIRDYEHAPAFHRRQEKVWAKRARSLLRKT
jgi:Tfp pilus assembly protein PilF